MDAKLAMKIYNVMCATESIEKDMVVGKGNNAYSAISEAAVLNKIKPLMKQEKLIMFPSKTVAKEITEQYPDQYDPNKTKLKSITQLVITFTLADAETGESVNVEVAGNGFDSLDKGTGKATTYAYKTAFQKTFCMFSGEDTDNMHSDEANGSKGVVENISTKQLEEALGDNVAATIEHYNKKTGSNITELKFMKQEWKRKYYEAKEKK